MSTFAVTFEIPGHLPSRANQRVHWRVRHKQSKAQRTGASVAMQEAIGPGRPLYSWYPIIVTMARISPRLLDDDNLQIAFKSVRDGIADALGVNDNDPRVAWEYEQEKGKPARVSITIQSKEA